MCHPAATRRGFTVLELVTVVAIAGLVCFATLHRLHAHLDRLAARSAVAAAALLVARAREEAIVRHALVTLHVDTATATVTLSALGRRFARAALGSEHGVRLAASRDSIAFDVRGLGYGAANTTLIARRGRAADTLVVSRLGRTRY